MKRSERIRKGTQAGLLWKITDREFVSVVKGSLKDVLIKDLLDIVLAYANHINRDRHALAMKMIRDLPTACNYTGPLKSLYYSSPTAYYRKLFLFKSNRPRRDVFERVYSVCETVNRGTIECDGESFPIVKYESELYNDQFYTVLTNAKPNINSADQIKYQSAEDSEINMRSLGIHWIQILEDRENGIAKSCF